MNPLRELQEFGQSVWLDYIRRSLITSGELARLVEEDAISGVTVNPSIFQKAVEGSKDYDDTIRRLVSDESHLEAKTLYARLIIEDVQMAADALRTVFDNAGGADGFVSLEVSPYLAHDTAGTIAEARRFWNAVSRPNLMIKVPATPAGIPAIEALTAEGINVNITLMFSLAHYEAVAWAYIEGLRRHPHPERVASVASFFVSRVDAKIDPALEAIRRPEGLALRGKIAIANARLAYRRFGELFYGEPFAQLRRRGARVQRPLWASTGTKNPDYSDVLYVEEMIGPDTVNTVPPATLEAFRDHGKVRGNTIEEGVAEAGAALEQLQRLGIDLNAITEALQREGVDAFIKSYDSLLGTLGTKRVDALSTRVDRQRLALGGFQSRLEARLEAWDETRFARRLWRKDPTLWSEKPLRELADRMGWLDLPEAMHAQVDDLGQFADLVRADGVRHIVLLGMGGSSLAPEVFARMFGSATGFPAFAVLDSTHPAAIREVEHTIDLAQTLFLVSSKSGTTAETLSLFRHFWRQTGGVGHQFVAITDPGTPLEQLARERQFRHVFRATADVGGRYSALTVFGLVPAALIGTDVHRVVDRAWTMAEACSFCVTPRENPALALGAALGELARNGRDKITFFASAAVQALPVWIEQLIAESTGKDGRGIIPVVDERPEGPEAYESDRCFVQFTLNGEGDLDRRIAALEAAGHPVVRIALEESADLGQEFFRWEMAVAAAGAVIGIHPFDQPDVELAKELARKAMAAGGSPAGSGVQELRVDDASLARLVAAWLGSARSGDYVALQAYLAPTAETTDHLQIVRQTIRDRLHLATTLGFGPRFLHSTGQLHKGGPNTGLFLQLVDEVGEDLPVPETDYTFAQLIRAQAIGDYQALLQRERRVLRVQLGKEVPAALARLRESLRG